MKKTELKGIKENDKIYCYKCTSASLAAIVFFCSFIFNFNSDEIQKNYLKNFSIFNTELNELSKAIEKSIDSDFNYQLIKEKYTAVRIAYKRIEPFTDYYDSLAVKYFINGSPLPKAEDEANLPNLIKAQGLQVIDETIYGDDLENNLFDLDILVDDITENAEIIFERHKNKSYSERHFFEAARRQLLKIFTLQLTNFDTPGSTNGIVESAISLNTLQHYLSFYKKAINNKSELQWHNINFLLEAGSTYLNECKNYEYFNHLEFYKEYLQPLYQAFYTTQKILELPSTSDLSELPQSINYDNQFIFDHKFFNASYFSETHERDISKDKASIGKLLFFDPILSSNNKSACATCHHPDKAFTDGLAKSLSSNFKDGLQRNSPTIINSTFADRYFWDMQVGRLSKQIEQVIINQKEFKIDFKQIADKLNNSEEYVTMFENAFPNIGINHTTIKMALVNYIISLSSFNSTFDKYMRGESDSIDENIKDGFNLFMGKAGCATCHFPPNFNGSVPPLYIESESEVLGVPATNSKTKPVIDDDVGRYGNGRRKEHFENYKHSFKTVSIRNVELTAPYMHNGIYNTLEEVLEFYNNGGGLGMGIAVNNQTLPGDSLGLSDLEQQQIISFMESLTDTIGLTSEPTSLPKMKDATLNDRPIGGNY